MSKKPTSKEGSWISPRIYSWILLAMFASFFIGWWKISHDEKLARDRANIEVEKSIDRLLPIAFAHWSTTQTSGRPLTPDLAFVGADSRIIAVDKDSIDPHRFLQEDIVGDDVAWTVLAQSSGGRYFIVQFRIAFEDTDFELVGWRRLFSHSFSVLTREEMADWLYRRNHREEYKREFGTDAPPSSVAG